MLEILFNDLKSINPEKKSMFFNFFFSNSFHIIFWYRISNFLASTRLRILSRIINAFVRIIYSCDISPYAHIGRGIIIMHGFDIVIGADVIVGDNVKIFNGVTLGNRKGSHSDGQPKIGDHCTLGTGAKILGNLSIGAYSVVGANSVVLDSFPCHSTIVSVPARKV